MPSKKPFKPTGEKKPVLRNKEKNSVAQMLVRNHYLPIISKLTNAVRFEQALRVFKEIVADRNLSNSQKKFLIKALCEKSGFEESAFLNK